MARRASLAEKFHLDGEDYTLKYEVDHQSCICHYGDKAKQLSDLQLTSNSRTFNVNKLILCYQSGFFERKITEDGPPTNSIVVNSIDESTMALIIEYLYHHRIDINQSNIVNLLVASSFLQINTLEGFCLDYITGLLASTNFVTISAVSHYYRNSKLKQTIAAFLLANFEAITATEKFKNMDKGEALDMLTIPSDKKGEVTEEMIYDAINIWANHDLSRRESYKVEFYQILDFSRLPTDFGLAWIVEDEYFRQALEIKQLNENMRKKRAQESLYIIGGTYTARHLYKIHLETKKFTKIKDLPFAHIGGAVVVKNEQIYCFGGWPHERQCGSIQVDKVEGYVFNPIRPLHEARLCPAVTLINGKDIYVTGGWDGSTDLSTSECYKQGGRSEWITEYHMETTKSGHAVCYVGGAQGRVVSFGGKSADVYLRNMEIYHIEKLRHTNGANMNCRRYGLTGEVLNEQIYAIGGFDGFRALDSVEKYERGRWVFVESMKAARYHHASAVVNNSIYVVGGFGADTSGTTVEMYDVNVDLWTIIISNLPEQFLHHSLVSLGERNENEIPSAVQSPPVIPLQPC